MTERRIRVVVDPSGAESGARRVNRSLDSMSNAAAAVQGALGRLLVQLGAGFAVGALVSKTIEVNREFGRLNAQLVTVTGSAEKAGIAFSALERFAATTPFSLQQAVEGFTKLKALGLDPSERSLRSYGNTAAAMGKSLNQMIEAVADAATGEFERLKEFGIKAKSEGDRVTFTFQGVATNVGKNAREIEDYLRGIGETKFGDAMAQQANTLDGAISNLNDEIGGLFRTIGELGATDAITEFVRGATGALQSLSAQIQGTARIYRESGLFGVLTASKQDLEGAATAAGRKAQLEAAVRREDQEFRRLQSAGGTESLNPFTVARTNAARGRRDAARRDLNAFIQSNSRELQAERSASVGGDALGQFANDNAPAQAREVASSLDKAAKAAEQRANAEQRINDFVARTLKGYETQSELARLLSEGRTIEAEMLRVSESLGRDLTRLEKDRLESAILIRDAYESQATVAERLSRYMQDVARAQEDAAKARQSDELAGIVGGIDRVRDGNRIAAQGDGSTGGRNDGLLAIQALGQVIGGRGGGGISKVAGLLQGLASGDFTGIGGPAGGALTLLSQRGKKDGKASLTEGIRDAFRQPVGSFKETGELLKGAFKSGGGLEKVLGKAAGGAAVGTAVAGIGNALGIKLNQTGSQIGGAIGSFIPIPGGEIIGSILGGLLGGIGPTPRAYSNINTDSQGNLLVSSGGSRGSKSAENKAAASAAAGGVVEALGSILGAVGGTLRAGATIGTIGPVGDQFGFATTGAVGGSNKSLIKFATAEQAAEALIRSVFSRGLVEGLDSFTQRVLASGKALEASVDLAARYRQVLIALDDRADPLGTAVKRALEPFDDLIRDMKAFGATAAELAKVEELRGMATKEALDEQLSGLRSLQSLLSGAGSGETTLGRLSKALAEYDVQSGRIGQDGFDQGAFTRLGQEVFGLARDAFGTSTGQFQDIRRRLIADTENAIGATESAFETATRANAPVVEAIDTQTQVAVQQYQQMVINNELLRQILAGGGGSVGFANDDGGAVNGSLVRAR